MDGFEVAKSLVVPSNHPSLPGHFPGHPVLPGVVTLSLVESALRRWQSADLVLSEAPIIKFHNPVLPGMQLDIAFRAINSGMAEFKVLSGGALLMEGRLKYYNPSDIEVSV